MSSRSPLIGNEAHNDRNSDSDSENALVIPESDESSRWRSVDRVASDNVHGSSFQGHTSQHASNETSGELADDAERDSEGNLHGDNLETERLIRGPSSSAASLDLDRPEQPASSNNAPGPSNSRNHNSSRSFWRNIVSSVTRSQLPASLRDGVFGNLIAKDEHNQIDLEAQLPVGDDLTAENDDLTPLEQPPTYEEASADATPSYWETAMLASSYGDDIIIGDMPVGSIVVFVLNLLLCVALQYFGFFLGYLFHTSHAAKYGSVSGLGILMIEASRDAMQNQKLPPGSAPNERIPLDPNSFRSNPMAGQIVDTNLKVQQPDNSGDSPWVARVLLIVGIFLILYSVYQYVMAIRARMKIRHQQRVAEAAAERAREAGDNATAQGTNFEQDDSSDHRYNPGSVPTHEETHGVSSEQPPRPGSSSPTPSYSSAIETV